MNDSVIIDGDAVRLRLKEKAKTRMEALEHLRRGEVLPKALQVEHSLFPSGWFESCFIEDLYENVGK